jgi:hypothetical protein
MPSLKRTTIIFCAVLTVMSITVSGAIAATATFDDLPLAPNSYWNGPDPNGTVEPDPNNPGSNMVVGTFTSGGAKFVNRFDADFQSWSGFAYSSMIDKTTPGDSNQYSAFTGAGHGPSSNYGIAYGYLDQNPNFYQSFAFNPNDVSQLQQLPYFDVPAGQHATSMYVTNTTYAALSMRDGDSFAKKFGPSDFFKLSIFGSDATGTPLGKEVDFYLASQGVIVNQWTQVDLSTLSSATRLYFNLYSSDVGIFGMNTPSYFALDDVQFSPNRTLGDFNLDGHVDARDIKAMEAALANLQGYQHGGNTQAANLSDTDLLQIGDLNGDNKINGADLQKLLNVLKSGGGSTSVPEPTTFPLLAIGGLAWLFSYRKARRSFRC